ncbi:MAG TPA: alpha-L-arabinofuranosidase [Chitinophagaceae bacterium]|nr:alpha-L-arabinofuranosidase [Chitinophagaceae bacterium]
MKPDHQNIFCGLLMIAICAATVSCKKARDAAPSGPAIPVDTASNPVDPQTAATIGFFLDAWKPRTFTAPANSKDTIPFSGKADVTITIDMNKVVTKVSPCLFGNNANTWMGQVITEPALIQYITDLSPHIIRAPGGSISDVYFWNQSSAPPPDVPDSLFDASGHKVPVGYWYGGNTGSWTLSLKNYYTLLQQTGSTGILTVNYAYARYGTGPHPVQTAAHLAADWVRYDHGRTKYWEIGNEDNGTWEAGYQIDPSKNKDGQPAIITGKLYGQQFKVFADSMRAAAEETGATIYIGAQLLEAQPASWQDATDQSWNEGVLTTAGNDADFFIVHDYFTPYNTNSNADAILATAVSIPSNVVTYLAQQVSLYGVTPKPVALTEWNIRATGAMQNVSYIAGMHAAITLGELIKNKFGEASRWDLANGWSNGDDQGMFNIGDEPGGTPKWNPRPAFFYLYFFQQCFGDRMVSATVQGGTGILCYASSFSSGDAGVVIVNKSASAQKVKLNVQHFSTGNDYYWYTLTGGAGGGFSPTVQINGKGPAGAAGGPMDYATLAAYRAGTKNGILITAPPYSVIYLQVANK